MYFCAMNFIVAGAIKAVKELYGQEIAENVINIQETRKEFEGQVTIVVFPIVRFSKNLQKKQRMILALFYNKM